jgi:7-cyano-7-deazaguanine synthase in queuosine biosynthesis
MKLVCATKEYPFTGAKDELEIILYGHADIQTRGSIGAAAKDQIIREKLYPAARAWDLLSIALAVTTADLAGSRDSSSDGWTRQFDLKIAVADPTFWSGQREFIAKLLGFLTTDLWRIAFIGGGFCPAPNNKPVLPEEDCVMLLSGGLDSLIGGVDLVGHGQRPLAVSQTVRGDAEKQRSFAQLLGGGLKHLQLNHNADIPNPEKPPSQRARSLIFIAYGVLAATTLKRYHDGGKIALYVCENGFISINPPLTGSRLGSLSTRTTHPVFLRHIQDLLGAADLRVHLENPYQLKTKGEMLSECLDQAFLREYAYKTTSCGRFKTYSLTHCGRCVPCLVRRAAFLSCNVTDATKYVYADIGMDDESHAGFDDVRSVAMALAEVESDGLENWIGTALSTALLGDVGPLQHMVGRGLNELAALFKSFGVK